MFWMKEVKYEGNLERDIKIASNELNDELMNESNFVNKVVVSSTMIVGIILATFGLDLFMFLDLLGAFVVVEAIIFGVYLDRCWLNIWEAKKRVESLIIDLEDSEIAVSELELLDKVKLKKSRLRLKKEDTSKVMTLEQRIVKYWSFLDRNEQIQVLKYIRYSVLNTRERKVTHQMFLLDEEDKNTLSRSLKKELKLYK